MLSVIVPCFNAERYLSAALASLIEQTELPAEIIVVDDGSTDASISIARAFGERVQVITQTNCGVSAARNRGIEASHGSLISFLDADDLQPRMSHQALRAALTDDASLSAGVIEQFVSEDVEPEVAATLAVPARQAGRLAGAFLVRRAVFDEIGLFNTTIALGETMEWMSRFEAAGYCMRWTPETVLRRRLHASNSVHKREQLKQDYLKVLRQDVARRRFSAQS